MNKSPLMLEAEKKIGENLEFFLPREYGDKWKSSVHLGRLLRIHPSSIRRWLIKLGVDLHNNEDYLSRRIKRPSNSVLKYYYHTRKPIEEAAKERGVHKRTFYRWIERTGIEMRHGSEAHLKDGAFHPSNKKLAYLLSSYSNKKVIEICGVDWHTLRTWKHKAGLHKFRKSRYDSVKLRRQYISDLFEESRKDLERIRYDDFRIYKKEDGKSYRGLLDWYISHHCCNFNSAKKYMIQDYSINGKKSTSKLSLESSL